MPTTLSGQFDLGSAHETVALPNNTDIASFTDSNTSDNASAFTASIDWGDGATSTGTVVGSNGNFTVEGGHTYADEGFFEATALITRTADNSQVAPTGTVAVADTDNLTPHGTIITFTANQPLTNVQVATFTDTNTVNTASDFVASIDWGDGTTTTGTVSGSNGSFSVSGSHTYAASGDNTITVFLNDDTPDAAFAVATSTAVSGFGGQVTLTTATELTALANVQVATFADTSGSHVAGDYLASIDWGDGSTTPGTVSGSGNSFTVTGSHTYGDEADDHAAVTITRTADLATTKPTGTVAVVEGDQLTPTPKTFGGQPNQPINNVVVATFSDVIPNAASDFTAAIDWGDGTSSAGTVTGSGGAFTVSGSHTYLAAGDNTVLVTLEDDDPGTATATATSHALIGATLAGDVVLTNANEGVAISAVVATFEDANNTDTPGSFTASIDWGDTTTTTGTVSGSNGSFSVSGDHTYADEATAPMKVTVTRISDNGMLVATGDVAVADSDALSGAGRTLVGDPGVALTNVTVATFTDTYTGNVATDFIATIDWGDGTTTPGTVSGAAGSFSVSGSHTYAANGHETIIATLTDDAPGTATATATGTADIGLAGQMVLTSATEHVALPNGTPVATFSDSNGGDTPASFTAAIDWGDGATSAGTVSGGAGTFTVSGGHTYADEANAPVAVSLVRTSNHSTGTASGNVAVGEHDALSAQGKAITGTSGQALNNVTVATFSDVDAVTLANDFAAMIDWGDGTNSAGVVSGSNGSFAVSGTHTYIGAGARAVTVTVADDAPGTAAATAHGTATIDIKNTLFDFNADGHGDFLWQNSDGTPAVWLMNGTGVLSQGPALSNPGPSWKALDAGDFNGDGKADILFQNDNGTPAVWLMNGTAVAQMGPGLPNSSPAWHAKEAADFNGDGKADILWQHDNGTAAVWTMDGTNFVSMGPPLTNPGPTWHVKDAADFNGDGKADILWQNDNGTPAVWLMNGTGVLSTGPALPNPGPAWHEIAAADFNGDGKADILWQNDDGTPAVWLMDGTAVLSAGPALTNPGTAWHVKEAADFNGDGRADIVWQHDNGTPAVWLMNGTSVASFGPALPDPGTAWHVI